MFAGIRSGSRGAIGAAVALSMASPVMMGATGQVATSDGVVRCATPDVWSGSARLSDVMPVDFKGAPSYRPPEVVRVSRNDSYLRLRISYRGAGVYSLRGAARARAIRRGQLWNVDPRTYPVGKREMANILLKAGASGAAVSRRGEVFFRARAADRMRIVDRAERIISDRASASTSSTSTYAALLMGDPTPSFDVAMLRMQGRSSADPMEFVEGMPSGVSVFTYGTSFVAHVPSYLVDGIWDQIDQEGERVLLVGASARPVLNAAAAQAIRFCGGSALLGRFPTPTVVGRDAEGLSLEIESQRVSVPVGDVVMVVQAPPYGRGIEIAMMRVVRR